MRAASALCLLPAFFPSLATALDADGWSKQSIYQLMTDRFARTDGSSTAQCDPTLGAYCGGTWQGIIQKLDYIQGMGFTAIWISPIVAQMEGNSLDGTSFHGFWAQDIWSVNSHFGTEDDLKQLSDELHSRGMYLMVDIVTNHMAYLGAGNNVQYGIFNPFNNAGYYHDFCLIDYSDEYDSNLQTCWEGDNIVSLPDLRTEDQAVRDIWMPWITEIVAKYGIDGLRIDSAKHMEKSFHPIFEAASGVYNIGEVLHGDPSYLMDYMNYMSGVTNYASYFWLKRAFGSAPGDFTELSNGVATLRDSGHNTSYLGNFLSNHDQETWANVNSDLTLNKNALSFLMTMDGIPIVFEGHEQGFDGDWTQGRAALWLSGFDTSSELYNWIAKLNQVRNHAVYSDPGFVPYQSEVIYTSGLTMATRKAGVVSVFSGAGTIGTDYDISLDNTGYQPNQAVVDVLGCTLETVSAGGSLSVTVEKGMPKIFRPLDQLLGSGICPDVTGDTGGETPTSTSSACTATGTLVPVTFEELATTEYGDTIKVVGSVQGLGTWNPGAAVALGAAQYTASNPLWSGTVNLEAGAVFQYKFINVDSSGNVAWEADPNHTATLGSCPTPTTISNTWQT